MSEEHIEIEYWSGTPPRRFTAGCFMTGTKVFSLVVPKRELRALKWPETLALVSAVRGARLEGVVLTFERLDLA